MKETLIKSKRYSKKKYKREVISYIIFSLLTKNI